MKKLQLKLSGVKQALTKEQMKGITGGYDEVCQIGCTNVVWCSLTPGGNPYLEDYIADCKSGEADAYCAMYNMYNRGCFCCAG